MQSKAARKTEAGTTSTQNIQRQASKPHASSFTALPATRAMA